MNVPELLRTIGERAQSGASVKSVYGEPVVSGTRTVIPVARVSYRFGGGGGSAEPDAPSARKGGGGGGGGVGTAEPCGLVEVTPEGTRVIPFPTGNKNVWAALALGIALGALARHFGPGLIGKDARLR